MSEMVRMVGDDVVIDGSQEEDAEQNTSSGMGGLFGHAAPFGFEVHECCVCCACMLRHVSVLSFASHAQLCCFQ